MDTRTGRIFDGEQVAALAEYFNGGPQPEFYKKLTEEERPRSEDLKPMNLEPTEKQKKRGKIGRNDRCPCGSGVKFKKCCLRAKE